MSGAASERDQSKKPTWMADYCLMRVRNLPLNPPRPSIPSPENRPILTTPFLLLNNLTGRNRKPHPRLCRFPQKRSGSLRRETGPHHGPGPVFQKRLHGRDGVHHFAAQHLRARDCVGDVARGGAWVREGAVDE